jgi:hypothetical protein
VAACCLHVSYSSLIHTESFTHIEGLLLCTALELELALDRHIHSNLRLHIHLSQLAKKVNRTRPLHGTIYSDIGKNCAWLKLNPASWLRETTMEMLIAHNLFRYRNKLRAVVSISSTLAERAAAHLHAKKSFPISE